MKKSEIKFIEELNRFNYEEINNLDNNIKILIINYIGYHPKGHYTINNLPSSLEKIMILDMIEEKYIKNIFIKIPFDCEIKTYDHIEKCCGMTLCNRFYKIDNETLNILPNMEILFVEDKITSKINSKLIIEKGKCLKILQF
jgi:hypothetical protein